MIIHDLYCPGCDAEYFDQTVQAGCYGECELCGTPLRWRPTKPPATDVLGSTQEDHQGVLTDAAGRNLTWTSSRERDRKMKEIHGAEPRGDRVRGARTGDDRLGRRSFHFGAASHRSVKGKESGKRDPAA